MAAIWHQENAEEHLTSLRPAQRPRSQTCTTSPSMPERTSRREVVRMHRLRAPGGVPLPGGPAPGLRLAPFLVPLPIRWRFQFLGFENLPSLSSRRSRTASLPCSGCFLGGLAGARARSGATAHHGECPPRQATWTPPHHHAAQRRESPRYSGVSLSRDAERAKRAARLKHPPRRTRERSGCTSLMPSPARGRMS